MLVLTRRVGESLTIGDDITVTLVSTKVGQAKIGIEAPRSVPVTRDNIKHKLAESKVDKEAVAFRLLEELYLSTLVLQPLSPAFDQALVKGETWARVKAFFHNVTLERMATEASLTVEGKVAQ